MDNKTIHGGKREGAGRKSKGYSEVRLRMSPKTIGLINEVAELMGCSRGEAVEKLIGDNVTMAKHIMKLGAALALERANKKSEV